MDHDASHQNAPAAFAAKRTRPFLNEAFDGQVQLGTVPAGDNHIGFACDEAACTIDQQQLEARAALLADQFPLDFPAIVASLREGAELRWAKAASAKALPTQQIKESHLWTKSTPT